MFKLRVNYKNAVLCTCQVVINSLGRSVTKCSSIRLTRYDEIKRLNPLQ